ncbi:hypothetical protein DICVIV_04442 [Dictyocaulus viviparus]|uniref:Rhodanese domain-containing protein n=1 Tax=Dictyocaulus viviparus TaxID=29172 RepID=A0A0D8XZX4_DICVI|nr:hypothetical protein DICVIV_04442 [Dictyocaulus viviparus]
MAEISAASLAALVRNADATTLIVDCRCLAEFKRSHICRAMNPFYSKLLQRRLLEDKVDHIRLANQLRSNFFGGQLLNIMVDVVLYTDEQSEKSTGRFCSKRRITGGINDNNSVKIVRNLRDKLECTNIFGKIQILEDHFTEILRSMKKINKLFTNVLRGHQETFHSSTYIVYHLRNA